MKRNIITFYLIMSIIFGTILISGCTQHEVSDEQQSIIPNETETSVIEEIDEIVLNTVQLREHTQSFLIINNCINDVKVEVIDDTGKSYPIEVIKYTVWDDKDNKGIRIIGEIKNNGDKIPFMIKFNAILYDAENNIIRTYYSGLTTSHRLHPGQTSSFSALIRYDDKKDFDHIKLNFSHWYAELGIYQDFEFSNVKVYYGTSNKVGMKKYIRINGSIQNTGDHGAWDVEVAGNIYNERGEILARCITQSIGGDLNFNETKCFEIILPITYDLPEEISLDKIAFYSMETKSSTYYQY